jgi:EF-hand domain pair
MTMSIAPASSGILNAIYSQAQPGQAKRHSGTASDPSASGAAPASDTVTLSAQAQAVASLNCEGVTMCNVSGPGLSGGNQPSGPIALYGSVSKSVFEGVAASFGATAQQADQDFAAMDTNGDGSISNAEMLSGMSQTSNSNDPLAQSLRQMMDTSKDGSVSGTEYVNLESALVYAAR